MVRVKCASCGSVYDRAERAKGETGRTNCHKCGSNASDPVASTRTEAAPSGPRLLLDAIEATSNLTG